MVRLALRRLLLALPFIFNAIALCGAEATDTRTGIFHPDFRTLKIELEGAPLLPPVLTLGGNDRLIIGFDALREDRDYLRYSIIHCNADWQPSELTDNELFDGFNFADVADYAFSQATTVHYVHYTIALPNEQFRFRHSGNYLLRVYPENSPEETLLQVRFMVSEAAVSLSGEVTSRTDIDYNAAHQQLTVNADLNRYAVRDPYNDLRLTITQNGRVDNAVTLLHPTQMRGTTAIYEHLPQLIFPAGNEYRRMETVQTTYPGMGVAEIAYHNPYYHHLLNTDRPRHSLPYSYDSTQHGRFFVREYNATSSDTEADYTVVHFTLSMLPIPDMDLYLDGDFTNRRFDSSSLLRYDSTEGRYHKALLLKQGAYNYQYLALPASNAGTPAPSLSSPSAPEAPSAPESATVPSAKARGSAAPALPASAAPVEGNHYQTVNEYLLSLYYRAPGERADRLLGLTLLHSGK